MKPHRQLPNAKIDDHLTSKKCFYHGRDKKVRTACIVSNKFILNFWRIVLVWWSSQHVIFQIRTPRRSIEPLYFTLRTPFARTHPIPSKSIQSVPYPSFLPFNYHRMEEGGETFTVLFDFKGTLSTQQPPHWHSQPSHTRSLPDFGYSNVDYAGITAGVQTLQKYYPVTHPPFPQQHAFTVTDPLPPFLCSIGATGWVGQKILENIF